MAGKDSADAGALLRQLPSVEEILREPATRTLLQRLPRWAVLDGVREALERARRRILAGGEAPDDLVAVAAALAEAAARPSLRRVINTTGVILHTNIGRACLPDAALQAALEAGRAYSTLEFDLEAGARGSRQVHVEGLLTRLTGAEAALAVNNNAAAVLLAINTLAEGREVLVSRGELVEIGGSFRIPDVMRKAGGLLREVGTTNRTHLRDYEAALSERTALLLKVHPSNFAIVGFTAAVPLPELVALGKRHHVPVMVDLGSGALADLTPYGVTGEETVPDVLRQGPDLVTCSGDKLLGGPQAGLVVGRRGVVEKLRKNPLARAVRIDKLSLAALAATLRLYLDGPAAVEAIPTLRSIALPAATIRARAEAAAEAARAAGGDLSAEVIAGTSEVGGGASPTEALPTFLLALRSRSRTADALEAALRRHDPPVLARIKDGNVLLDLRTVAPEELPALTAALRALAAGQA
ncbi:MAG TPA: L-seryl-tRNA(Sec) selenium transferase [Candidatus Methylomirabilis sp.]|nr:L-seryl-tRNA(Sec) selenium transferase [Candidatus Methylomirabilis sp.]